MHEDRERTRYAAVPRSRAQEERPAMTNELHVIVEIPCGSRNK